MKKLFLILTSITFLYSQYTPEEAKENFLAEMLGCAVYLDLMVNGAPKNSNSAEIQTMKKYADNMLAYHLQEKVEETTMARYKLFKKEMLKEMDNHYANASRLILKYNDNCGEIIKNPSKRFDYWLNKN